MVDIIIAITFMMYFADFEITPLPPVDIPRANFSLIQALCSVCLNNVAVEPFGTLEMRDRAQQGHLLLIRFSTVASNSQVRGLGRGAGGG